MLEPTSLKNLWNRFRGWLCLNKYGSHYWILDGGAECCRCSKFRFLSGYGNDD